MKKSFKMIAPESRADFRRWLKKNYKQTESIWVVIFKISSGKANLSLNDVVEEALCFGWIDSVPGKIDSDKYKLLVSPRRPTSVWSAVNKRKVKNLIQLGLMTPAGLAKVSQAKRNGSWDKLNASDRFEVPKELTIALKKNKKASEFFQSIAPLILPRFSGQREMWYNHQSEKRINENTLQI